ncbi:uncharacterized protein LOC112519703 [Cynara cardunculus var. scolymus]|nr:uncharacterized protein LOC112519703 [Cynara cardunculus var. scolymus]
MASFNHSLLIALISIYLSATATAIATISGSDIHDILPEFGLPKGILPDAVESYTLSPSDGAFTVQLTRPCYVQFDDQTVYYSKNIQGKLTYGSVSDVSGIQAKQFFLWLSVTGMDLDTSSNMIEFHVGVLSKKLPADMFLVVPDCKSKACQHKVQSQSI